jgi:glycosyltransferase involved in cell wall biosynthesis
MSSLITMEQREPGAEVLVVTNVWPHEAEPRYGIFAKRQVDSLRAAGVSCDVMFVRGFESPLAYAAACGRVLAAGLTRRYRLVHGHGGETVVPCMFFRGARLVSFCGDDLLGTPTREGALSSGSRRKAWVLGRLALLVTRTITKSREMHEALPARARARNTVLPNGVDREFFRPIDRAEARRRLGWSEGELVALFAGDPELPRKRHDLALAACAEAQRLLAAPVRLHVAHTVPPHDMPALMSAADCLLMTSAIEGSPNAVKEAVTCGLPVVATPAGDVAEVLDGVVPSYVCEPRPEELGDALARCLQDPQRSNGRARAAWLDEKQIAARLVALYAALAGVSSTAPARGDPPGREDGEGARAPRAPR